MELQFDVAERLGFPSSNLTGPTAGKVPQSLLPELLDTIDALSAQSAVVRQLETEWEDNRLQSVRLSEDSIYLLSEGSHVLGFARVGVRSIKVSSTFDEATKPKTGGYAAFSGSLMDVSPCCLFDFFIFTGFERRGLGQLLFEAMLLGEGGLNPAKLAYSRPSDAMSAFLAKHCELKGGKPLRGAASVSSFTLFEEFFDASVPATRQAPVADSAAEAKKVELDEPVVEEVEALDADPLLPYRKDEDEFYTQRTKLFCFNVDAWQDAGAGQVSLLKNRISGRVRLVFVQEAAKRVIANHFVINQAGYCELARHTAGNDKTWTWTAQERVLERRFALKFKTGDDAAKFKEVFEGVKRLAVESKALEYVTLRKVGVTAEAALPSRHVKLLAAGAAVNVVEVAYFAEDKRVRARLVHPEGWITVLSHNDSDAASYAMTKSDFETMAALQPKVDKS